MLWHKTQGAGFGAAVSTAIEDVFSTYLYTGNGSTQTITNGIDLAGEGGLVWLKQRDLALDHLLMDSERGATKYLSSNTTSAENSGAPVTFTSTGLSIASAGAFWNQSGNTYASWTFRKAPRFFDVVTWTGTGSAQAIAHNLGVEPGCIIIKRTDGITNWQVYHRGLNGGVNPEQYGIQLNLTNAQGGDFWSDTAPTSTEFTVSGSAQVGGSGLSYVAYLFAHDPLGPSGDGSDGLIACGSYTGNGNANGPEINLGWEPQWVLIKNASTAGHYWHIYDVMRGWVVGGNESTLLANTSDAENGLTGAANYSCPISTGFRIESASGEVNTNGNTYIYIAIRRGPMREPTSGTEVFQPAIENSTDNPRFDAPFPVDMAFQLYPTGGSSTYPRNGSRLTGTDYLVTSSTVAAGTTTNMAWDYMQGFFLGIAAGTGVAHMFRRAPGFFDVVAYTGNGVAGRTVPHNLGVAPEMMIVKARNNSAHWAVYYGDPTAYMFLNSTNGATTSSSYWNNTAPSSTVFTLGTISATNVSSAYTYIAYLFATLPGISKVGSYTGNGSSQTINCGFTGGARFVLIKRTDSTGDWYVWDTARGIVSGNDPHLSLNTTAAEVTTDDSIDPDSSGFIVNQVAATNINVSSASYIFYAIS